MLPRFILCLYASVFLSACIHSVPTADVLDGLEKKVRAEYNQDYVNLEDQRRAGALSAEDYVIAKGQLDKRVQNRVDTMAWNRHALVQSDMKANAIPTPDKPQELTAPGVGTIGGSVYQSNRQTGMGEQAMGQMVRGGGAGMNRVLQPGTMYDNQ